MRMTTEYEELARLEFARQAAKHFAENPKHVTYTKGEVAPGELFAVRWGLGMDCVLVFRIANEDIVNYQQLIKEPPGGV